MDDRADRTSLNEEPFVRLDKTVRVRVLPRLIGFSEEQFGWIFINGYLSGHASIWCGDEKCFRGVVLLCTIHADSDSAENTLLKKGALTAG